MNTEKSPVSTKLVVVLLTLILAALAVIIVQNYQKQQTEANKRQAQLTDADGTNLFETKPDPSSQTSTARAPISFRPAIKPASPSALPPGSVAGEPVAVDTTRPELSPNLSARDTDAPAAVVLGRGVANEGQITGRVTLTGTPPPAKVIDLTGPFAMCGDKHPGGLTTKHYVVGSDRGLANVFVYIKEGVPKTAPSGPAPVLNQVNCVYDPYVLGVVAGQDLIIRNSDELMHNVHALPTVPGNAGFNFAQFAKGQTNAKRFDVPEVLVKFQCDVHGWMFAYVGVVPHPYFAVTDTNGFFQLPAGLPSGDYVVGVVHPKAGISDRPVKFTAGDKLQMTFDLKVPDLGVKFAAGTKQ